jgi:chromosome segregation ATPase
MEKENSFLSQDHDKLSLEAIDRVKTASNDKAFGIRDALLVKCRDTIESLNLELEEEKRTKKHLESQIKDLEHTNAILEHKLRSQEVSILELKEQIDQLLRSEEQIKSESQKLSFKQLQEVQTHMSNTVKSLEHSLSTLQEENLRLKNQLESEKARSRESGENRKSLDNDRLDLEKIELELEELYEKKHRHMRKDFEKKQEILREEMNHALDEIEIERKRYQEMYKASVDENNNLRQEIKYLQSMLQRKQNQLEKHSQQSLDQLQNILEKKNLEQCEEFRKALDEVENEKSLLECLKNDLQKENFRLKERVESLEDFEKKYENLNNEYFVLKANIFELEQKLKEQKNEKKVIGKNLDDLRKVLIDEPDSSEARKTELVKIKYQALLQAEMQKRLKDKQDYKQHLIEDKEAFLAKLRVKEERILQLESEKKELLCEINYLRCQIVDDLHQSDRRIVNADTARVISNQKLKSKFSELNQGVKSIESGIITLESRFSKY